METAPFPSEEFLYLKCLECGASFVMLRLPHPDPNIYRWRPTEEWRSHDEYHRLRHETPAYQLSFRPL